MSFLSESYSDMPQNDDLETENQFLKENVKNLTQQLASTSIIAATVESIRNENISLRSDLKNMQFAKEELQYQLSMSQQEVEELQMLLKKERERSDARRSEDMLINNNEIEKLRITYKSQIDKLNETIKDLNEQITNDEIAIKLCNSKCDRAFLAAERYFGQEVSSIDELITVLDKCKLPSQQNNSVMSTGLFDAKDSKQEQLIKLNQKYKSGFKLMKKENEEIRQRCKDLEKQNCHLQLEIEKHATDFEGKIDKFIDEKEKLEKNYQIRIDELQGLNDKMKSELANEKSIVAKLTDKLEELTQNTHETSKSRENQSGLRQNQTLQTRTQRETEQEQIIEQLQLESERLQCALVKCDGENKELLSQQHANIEKLNQSEEMIAELQKVIQKLEFELTTKDSINKELQGELEDLRKVIHDVHIDPIVEKPEKGETLNRDNTKHYKAKIRDLKRELSQLKTDKSSCDEQMLQLNLKITQLAEENKDLEHRNKQLLYEYEDLQKIINKSKSDSETAFINADFWKTSDFDDDIAIKIVEIADNSYLQPASKMQLIYKLFKDKFCEIKQSCDAAIQQYQQDQENAKRLLQNFVSSVSIIVLDKPLTVQDIENGEGDDFITSLTDLRNGYEAVVRDHNCLEQCFDVLAEHLNFPSKGEPGRIVDEVRSQLNDAKAAIIKYKTSKHNLKKELELLKTKCKEQEDEFEQKVDEYECKIYTYSSKINNLENQLDKLKDKYDSKDRENTELLRKVHQLNRQYDELQEEMTQIKKTVLATESVEKKQSHEAAPRSMQPTQNGVIVERMETHSYGEFRHFESEIKRLTSKINSLETENISLKDHIKQLTDNIDVQRNKLNKKSESEKQNLKEAYEKCIEQLREKSQAQIQEIVNLSGTIDNLKEQMRNRNKLLASSQNEKRKLEGTLRIRSEGFEREKKTFEIICKDKIARTEADCASKLECLEQRRKADISKLVLFAATEFKSYVNINDQLDERTFKSIIKSVKETLENLKYTERAIRNLTRATDNQTTEDSVAQLLMQAK